MGILLIDSASEKIEFGYAKDSEIIFKKELDSNHNADTLTYFIKNSFNKHKLSFKDIQTVSLSNGPGSFTGLRIGSAIAKGICFANGSKLVEIPTLDIIANKHKTNKKIVSLIFSNSKTLEFYFCEYKYKPNHLNKISDHKIGKLEDIIIEDADYLINESIDEIIPPKFQNKLIDVSGISNIFSQFELTKEYIFNEKFTDFKISQPFYMKEFVPKI